MRRIKCWISVNTLSQLLGSFCIYLSWGVLWKAGFIKASALVVGGFLYLVNYLTVPTNVVLLIILSIKSTLYEQLTVKQITFIAINTLICSGYIFIYLFFLKDAMRAILA